MHSVVNMRRTRRTPKGIAVRLRPYKLVINMLYETGLP
jgi:hypothetical protein